MLSYSLSRLSMTRGILSARSWVLRRCYEAGRFELVRSEFVCAQSHEFTHAGSG